MKHAGAISEARARILWGESSTSVRSFLTSSGLTGPEADAVLQDLNAERSHEIRQLGFRKTVFGAALIIGTGIFLGWSYLHVDLARMHYRGAKGFAVTCILIGLGGLYGISKVIDGIICLVRPQSERRSVSDISEE